MTAIAKRLQQEFEITGRNLSASVVPLSEVIVGNVRPILLMLLGGAALLLLIACVNVASLVLVRSESRKREIAVRRALGGSLHVGSECLHHLHKSFGLAAGVVVRQRLQVDLGLDSLAVFAMGQDLDGAREVDVGNLAASSNFGR